MIFYVGFVDFEKELVFLCTIQDETVSFSLSDSEKTFIEQLITEGNISFFSLRKLQLSTNTDEFIMSNELGNWIYPLMINGINVGNMVIQDIKLRKQTFIFQNLQIHKGKDLFIDWQYDSIYFDLDDTLIFKGSTNDKCLALAEINKLKGNCNVLITRHPNDIRETFEKFGMNLDLFDSVIQIKGTLQKSKFFNQNEVSAFIDNEFLERLDIVENTTSHAFDLDCVDILIESLRNSKVQS